MPKILIVDDSRAIRLVLTSAFKRAGFDVVDTDNPVLVLGLVHREKPDVLLLDVSMPLLDGDRVAAFVSDFRDKSKLQIKVMLYSGLPGPELAEKARSSGADGYALKTDGTQGCVDAVKALLAE